jgi:dihydrofolate synthase/folylpolyglutamate synthase
MEEASRILGVPAGGSADFFHVAGTNGKGTTTAFLQSLLIEQGYRTGSYYSPFVYSVRERIQVNRDLISEEAFARHVSQVVCLSRHLENTPHGGITEFEAKTLAGFLTWRDERCEAVALEVGLGGRLDATNIVQPIASLITSIGLDHVHILGSTYREIATEKAGIIKPGLPVVVGDLPPEAKETVRAIAADRGSEAWFFGEEICVEGTNENFSIKCPGHSWTGLSTRLWGAKSVHNAALAVSALAVAGFVRNEEAISAGLARAWLPGRFQVLEWGDKTLVLDGGHNEEAALVLRQSLRACFPGEKITYLVGMNEGHLLAPFLKNLSDESGHLIAVTLETNRARKAWDIAKAASGYFAQIREAASLAEALASAETRIIVATGSFYLLANVVREIGENPSVMASYPGD